MITCNFFGGLGNNLFQLATTYAIHKKYNFDYAIPSLTNRGNIAVYNQEPNLELTNLFENNFIYNDSLDLPIYQHIDTYLQKYEYTPIQIQDNICYHGYFQSEKYFLDIDINKEFVLNKKNIEYIRNKYSHFFNKKNISIHYRLAGDRVTPQMQHFHKNVSVDYYKQAFNILTEYTPDEYNILVFSDNVEYSKILLNELQYPFNFIENETNVIDFTFMALCNTNIISNSTFSWWSAYMNQIPNKKVIATHSEWFGPGYSHLNLNDIFPKTWIQI
jgi:hypothetical protein